MKVKRWSKVKPGLASSRKVQQGQDRSRKVRDRSSKVNKIEVKQGRARSRMVKKGFDRLNKDCRSGTPSKVKQGQEGKIEGRERSIAARWSKVNNKTSSED